MYCNISQDSQPKMYSQISLLCEEDDIFSYRNTHHNSQFYSVSEADFGFIEMQFQKETKFRPPNRQNFRSAWLKSARSDAIKWTLEKMSLFGYCYNTAYLSLIYFDRFLARKKRPVSDGAVWYIRVLSAVCLCLAAKVEEYDARLISNYTVMGYEIDETLFLKRELKLLDKLQWQMLCATPFTYLNYFASKFCGDNKALVIRSAESILAIMEEINVAENPPSVVAAAAVLAEYDHRLTKTKLETKIDLIPSWGTFEKEHTFTCYCILQQVVVLKEKTPKSDISSNSSSSGVVDGSTRTRRRLDFDDDQTSAPKISKS